MSLLEGRAQELLSNACTEVMRIQDLIEDHKESIKDIKDELKSEGLNVKAFNTALKRYKEILKGKKEEENTLSESDIYLEVFQQSLS